MDAKGGFRLQMSEKLSRVRPGGGRDRLAHSENRRVFVYSASSHPYIHLVHPFAERSNPASRPVWAFPSLRGPSMGRKSECFTVKGCYLLCKSNAFNIICNNLHRKMQSFNMDLYNLSCKHMSFTVKAFNLRCKLYPSKIMLFNQLCKFSSFSMKLFNLRCNFILLIW